ncbi:hypothetical protein SAMN05216360_10912 [Methylobacterium phyllostachyos]|uniref:Collagen, middle region n=1 Tax=Methylobacterium phyllostachyos TaxID=582672 RepID=A0A1H0C3Y6_9HYPH|nr:hypothetical protein [Methylobacterium phyllostachyos]SDN52569.1 hypothetical protein SAMN05216360_10912 [Methylobacterium phyllostachyos]
MSSSPLAALSPASRSLEWIVGSGALLSSTALSTGQLASLGPIASLIEGAVGTDSASNSGSLLPESLADTANTTVLDTHAQLETVGHEVAPLNGPLHGLTNLGETIGLGHIGESGNLITDLSGTIANPDGIGAAAPLLTDAGHVTDAAGTLLDTVAAVPATGNGLVGSGSILTPVTDILNQAILDLHTTLEDVGHSVPVLNAPIHALTGLGETTGLGYLGEPGNLLTDTLAVPGSLLNGGGLASADPVLSDLGHVLGATGTLLTTTTGVANAGGLLGSGGLLAPVTNLANTGVLDLHMTLENLGHEIPLLNDTLHGLTNLGETVGLGHIGESGNLLTDVAALPGDILGGQGLGAVSPILGDLGAVTNAAGGLVDGATGIVGGLGHGESGIPVVGSLLTPVTAPVDGLLGDATGGGQNGTGALLGAGAPPVGDAANGLLDTVHSVVTLGNTAGLGQLGDGSNLVTDTVNLPGAVLAGNGTPALGQIVTDPGHVVDAVSGVLGSTTGALPTGGDGGQGSATGLDGVLTPVTTALGSVVSGAAGDATGTLLGSLTGGTPGEAGAGTHPLVEVGAGPTTATPVADAAILTPTPDSAHTVQVSAVSVPADQPSLATANLLTGDSIQLPQTSGGADSLVGHLADAIPVTSAAPADAGASQGTSVDLGIATIDLGGHADVQHVDPTPHTATSGLHLLGL